MVRRGSFAALSTAVLLSLVGLVGLAQPAAAAPADKPAVLAGFTQTSVGSYNAFFAARANQAAWAAYAFDWSTDKCSDSPDNPLGFPFENGCIRHDFGYRNYKAIGTFPANKARLDSMLLADLERGLRPLLGADQGRLRLARAHLLPGRAHLRQRGRDPVRRRPRGRDHAVRRG
jgi:Prokaryotic phospholipase A2